MLSSYKIIIIGNCSALPENSPKCHPEQSEGSVFQVFEAKKATSDPSLSLKITARWNMLNSYHMLKQRVDNR